MLARFRALHAGPIVARRRLARRQRAAALGRGGGRARPQRVRAVAAVSAPLDLAAGGRAIGRGFGRQVYTRMFLRTMKPKALVKLAPASRPVRRDGDARGARPARFRRRLHRRRCTASPTPTTTTRAARRKPHLHRIRIPALVLNARNDPFLPASALPRAGRGRRRRHAVAARARRPRRLRRRAAGPGTCTTLPRRCRRLARRAPLARRARKIARMDDIVAAALKKWPNVPHCYGWLALDARGDWYMRDDRTQAAGPFPRVKGSRIEHEKLREFIARNYAARRQRRVVLPERAAARLRRARGGAVGLAPAARPDVERRRHQPHRAAGAAGEALRSTRRGRLFVATDLGLGIVHTLDMDVAGDAVERGVWQPRGGALRRARRALRLPPEPGRATARSRRMKKAGARPACSAKRLRAYFDAFTM